MDAKCEVWMPSVNAKCMCVHVVCGGVWWCVCACVCVCMCVCVVVCVCVFGMVNSF